MLSSLGFTSDTIIILVVLLVVILIIEIIVHLQQKMDSIDEYIKGAGLKNALGQYPEVDKSKSKKNIYYIKLKAGLSTKDFDQQRIEEFLNRKIANISSKDGYVLITQIAIAS